VLVSTMLDWCIPTKNRKRGKSIPAFVGKARRRSGWFWSRQTVRKPGTKSMRCVRTDRVNETGGTGAWLTALTLVTFVDD
jgi:hypothetical protein